MHAQSSLFHILSTADTRKSTRRLHLQSVHQGPARPTPPASSVTTRRPKPEMLFILSTSRAATDRCAPETQAASVGPWTGATSRQPRPVDQRPTAALASSSTLSLICCSSCHHLSTGASRRNWMCGRPQLCQSTPSRSLPLPLSRQHRQGLRCISPGHCLPCSAF